jgi:multidrug resistance efflux pump
MSSLSPEWHLSFSTLPVSPKHLKPEVKREIPRLEPVPPAPKKTRWGLFAGVAVAALLGIVIWVFRHQIFQPQAAPGPVIRTAQVQRGNLENDLRIAGTVTAKQYASIRAPRLTGPESRGPLTLMYLARAGSMVKVGDVVAEFERRQGQDHVDDVKSQVAQKESDVEKRRAELMIAEETTRQALRVAKGEYEKAQLDMRTAEVRSSIEAALLKVALMEKEATWKQLEEQLQMQQRANQAELRGLELAVAKERNHLGRHVKDLEHMTVTAPVPGLVVMESSFRNGQFSQVETGDQVFPQTLFMQVVDVSEMIVSGVANQADIQGVHIGQQAEVRLDAYPDMVLPGQVTAIGALAAPGGGAGRSFSRGTREEWVRGVEIQIAIKDRDERVIPDLSASASIRLSEIPDQLLVPRSAIRHADDGATLVQVQEGDGFEPREVEIGAMNATYAVVLDGLSENETVALDDIPTGS